ncbi:MAG: toxin-antitoxin system YwqK family antitoxin [Bacteroidales bacterium]|nr:toxin-antitoxin system YwqK family antitoxin [Bacteroidales bacterium]
MLLRFVLSALCIVLPLLSTAQNVTDTEGRKQGPWVKHHPNGKVMYEGTFIDDKPTGIFKRYDTDGNIVSELTYIGNTEEVRAMFFYPDGRKAGEGTYLNKKKEGQWKFYPSTEPQYMISEEYYHDDIKHGLARKFHPDGTLAESIAWDHGKKTGGWLQYYPDGKVCLRAEFMDGKLNGPFSFYYPNGKLQFEGRYKDDFRDGDWMVFNEDGSLKQVMVYRQGRLSDPEYSERETKFLDDLEKNRGKIKIPDINGNIIP